MSAGEQALPAVAAQKAPTLPRRLLLGLLVIVVSALGMLFVDEPVLQWARSLDLSLRQAFRSFTDIGTSGWILIPSGTLLAIVLFLRRKHISIRSKAAWGWIASLLAFIFVSVGGAGLAASMTKNIIGRARPKMFDDLGAHTFEPFTFMGKFAAFPSGHSATIFALATVLAMLWPRGRRALFAAAAVIASTRFLIGAHYFTDVVVGAVLGIAFTYLVRARFAERRWLFALGPDGGYRLRGHKIAAWAASKTPGVKRQAQRAAP
jgi:membrane-associated phospholipid phosphatase